MKNCLRLQIPAFLYPKNLLQYTPVLKPFEDFFYLDVCEILYDDLDDTTMKVFVHDNKGCIHGLLTE